MKYTRAAVFIFLIVCCTSSFSQNKKFLIADRHDRSSLAYAKVKILNANRGYFADNNGAVKVPNNATDSIMIEYSGYVTGKLILKNIEDTVFLDRKELELLSVQIKDTRVKKMMGSFKYKKLGQFFMSGSIEYATKIDLSEIKGNYKIQQIYLPMDINKKTFKDCVVKLHLYSEGEDGNPGEDLLTKPVFIKNDSLVNVGFYIDISMQKLILSEKYLFVGVECIMDKITALYNPDFTERKAFNQRVNLSPISLYFSKEKQLFAGGYGNKFTRFLNSSSYSWSGNTYSKDPINFAGGLVVLCNE